MITYTNGKKDFMKKLLALLLTLALLATVLVGCGNKDHPPYNDPDQPPSGANGDSTTDGNETVGGDENPSYVEKYENAWVLIQNGDYEAAYKLFEELGDYKDAKEQLEHFKYMPAKMIVEDLYYTQTTEFSYTDKGLPIRLVDTISRSNNTNETNVYVYTYDDHGNMLSKIRTAPNGKTYNYYYTYDDNGNLIEMNYSNSSNQTSKDVYTYDDNGVLLQYETTNLGGRTTTCVYTYDSNGNLIKDVQTSKDSQSDSEVIVEVYEYVYDTHGNLVKEILPAIDGAHAEYGNTYTYDSQGNLTKIVKIGFDGKAETYEYTYDDASNMVKKEYTNTNNSKDIIEYTYDNEGRIIKEISYSSENEDRKTIYDHTYDANGILIKSVTTNHAGNIIDSTEIEYKLIYFPFEMTDMINDIIGITDRILS